MTTAQCRIGLCIQLRACTRPSSSDSPLALLRPFFLSLLRRFFPDVSTLLRLQSRNPRSLALRHQSLEALGGACDLAIPEIAPHRQCQWQPRSQQRLRPRQPESEPSADLGPVGPTDIPTLSAKGVG